MKTYKDFKEAVSRAQQAAIAIAKKKSGKYDKDGNKIKEEQGPCWDGYKQVGMKKKGNKMVPNCVPVGEGVKQDKEIKDREGTQPAKYYAKDAEGDDMSKSTKQARARHFEKKKSGPAPGDKGAKTKPSKHTLKYKQMFGENKSDKAMMMKLTTKAMKLIPNSPDQKELIKQVNVYRKKLGMKPMKEENLNEKIEGLVKKAEKSGISYGILKKVYDRGMAAYKTGHRPGTTAQQWAFARVNSFITKGKGTWGGADKDLAAKARG
tara:strand:+ start:120 stop:911 length:792 start_codon:yes stop_codon:yes gene_type:complete